MILRGKALLLVATATGAILLGAAITFRADLLPRHADLPQPPVIHDVTWFKAHGSERAAALRGCENNPGLAPMDPNCANAEQAALDNSFQNEREAARRELGIQ